MKRTCTHILRLGAKALRCLHGRSFYSFKPEPRKVLEEFCSYYINKCSYNSLFTLPFRKQTIHTHFCQLSSANDTNVGKDGSTTKTNSNCETRTELFEENQNELSLFEDINYSEILGDDSVETLDRFKLLILEVDVMRQDGMRVPKSLSTENWKELLNLPSRSQRQKMLGFLWLKEVKKLSDKRKKELKKLAFEEQRSELNEENETSNIKYGFQGSTIFLRVYDTAINFYDNTRLAQAMITGQKVIIDCGYDINMSMMENKLCAKQLTYMFAENRLHKQPFDLHFCNFNKNTTLYNHFKKMLPTIEDVSFPINISQDHYLNMFPKEKLVYLTPHCRTELTTFDSDDIYIVGALVDKINNEPLSLAKAKSEGLRMAQLPLDRYLDWELGTKSLTINQVINILLDVHMTGDWNIALKNVPRRKVRSAGEPRQDKRKLFNRGTTFQPPSSFHKKKRFSQN